MLMPERRPIPPVADDDSKLQRTQANQHEYQRPEEDQASSRKSQTPEDQPGPEYEATTEVYRDRACQS